MPLLDIQCLVAKDDFASGVANGDGSLMQSAHHHAFKNCLPTIWETLDTHGINLTTRKPERILVW